MPRQISSATSLDLLRKEAKRWLKALQAQQPDAQARFARAHQRPPAHPTLRDVQHALAREYGFDSWKDLTAAVRARASAPAMRPWHQVTAREYEQLAQDFSNAHDARDEAALSRLNAHYARSFSYDDLSAEIWRRVYAFRQRSSKVDKNFLTVPEAQVVIAQDAGFGSWDALLSALTGTGQPAPALRIDDNKRIGPLRQLTEADWDRLFDVMTERHIPWLVSAGQMTDGLMRRLSKLKHVTMLGLGGSRLLTDEGLKFLADMPQLEGLELTGTGITDRGLEVLQRLPNLRTLEMTWLGGISDSGIAHLKSCDRLERINLMGSPTGDGAIEALQGKASLRVLNTGRLVTDAGLRLLRNIPRLRSRQDDQSTELLIDGPFTDDGLGGLEGLNGITDLSLFWHTTNLTADGFTHLVKLPSVAALAVGNALSTNGAMPHIARMPALRRLQIQDTVADDDGFEALSRSTTIEEIWTRDCPSLGNRGFLALSTMPALRSLGVTFRHVDDAAAAVLPRFPALRAITPIAMRDPGFAHIGRCEQLERLTCMYCRETGDAATAHIAKLALKHYYAGLTQITDRSLEILGRMPSLETIELYDVKGITDPGVALLKRLPRLTKLAIDASPGVTFEATRGFPPRVNVTYSP